MGWRRWRLRNGSVKLHVVNRSNIEGTCFDRFVAVVGTAKVNKYQSEKHCIGKGELG